MAFSAGVCGRQELNMHLPVKCCPRSFGIASNSRFKLFLDTINLRVRSSLIAIEMTRFYSHFRYAGESSILFSTHVMVCGRVPERLCYVWIKRYLLVWIKPYPNQPLQKLFTFSSALPRASILTFAFEQLSKPAQQTLSRLARSS